MMGPRATRYRAASLTRAAMLYRRALKRGEVPAEGTKDAPLCMDTYRCVSYIPSNCPEFIVRGKVDVRLRTCTRYRGT